MDGDCVRHPVISKPHERVVRPQVCWQGTTELVHDRQEQTKVTREFYLHIKNPAVRWSKLKIEELGLKRPWLPEVWSL